MTLTASGTLEEHSSHARLYPCGSVEKTVRQQAGGPMTFFAPAGAENLYPKSSGCGEYNTKNASTASATPAFHARVHP